MGPMLIHEYQQRKVFLGRLPHDADLLGAIQDLAAGKGLEAGVFWAIGAVKKARVAFYRQVQKEYREVLFPRPLELLLCHGNISRREGALVAHAHVTLADEEGRVFGGHLLPGTPVFAAEICLAELAGPPLERGHDEVTGLPLWCHK